MSLARNVFVTYQTVFDFKIPIFNANNIGNYKLLMFSFKAKLQLEVNRIEQYEEESEKIQKIIEFWKTLWNRL